eukprot:6197323-Pleurochrysis_carterae.AAC.2
MDIFKAAKVRAMPTSMQKQLRRLARSTAWHDGFAGKAGTPSPLATPPVSRPGSTVKGSALLRDLPQTTACTCRKAQTSEGRQRKPCRAQSSTSCGS